MVFPVFLTTNGVDGTLCRLSTSFLNEHTSIRVGMKTVDCLTHRVTCERKITMRKCIIFVCLICGLASLSTAMVMSGCHDIQNVL